MFLQVGIICLLALLFFSRRLLFGSKKFHVEVEEPKIVAKGFNILPFIKIILGLLPNSTKTNNLVKEGAPKPGSPLRDKYDCNKEDPYDIQEVVPNKIWKVQHSSENSFFTTKAGKEGAAVLGMDFNSKEFEMKMKRGAAKHSEEAVRMVPKDLETARYWTSKDTIADEDVFKIPAHDLNMMVVRLTNGSLLLYAPVRIRDETGFGAWLDKLGNVEWIVIASSEHNLNIPSVLKRYPNAKVIGSKVSELKLNIIEALPKKRLYYDYSNEEALAAANEVLKENGVELFYISGDIATHAVFCVAHGTGLECDLLYSRADDEKKIPDDWTKRVFQFGLISNSPNGMLPNYRFWFMDPSALGCLMVTPPENDGSSCREMARSLRRILELKFDQVVPVHAPVIDADVFKKSIDLSWNWLDGSSLLSKRN